MTVHDKFTTTRDELNAVMLERHDEIDIAMTSLLCNQHCLFVGDPGTGKSLLADAFADWIDGKVFKVLLNKTTTPEELVGPISIQGMKEDTYKRITTNMLPEADVAFLDEIFKGSSAILNTMLKILNERQFTNAGATINCPLRLCIGASNEFPMEAKELGALFDRFLFRKIVNNVASDASVDRLMFDDGLTPLISTSLALSELKVAQVEAAATPWSSGAKEAAIEIRKKLLREGVIIGDRRLRQSALACRSFAWLNGNSEVTTDDLEILSHIWWVSPEGQPEVVSDTVAEIAKPSRLLISQLLADAQQIRADLDMKDFATHGPATHKLQEIYKKLKAFSDSKRAEDAKKAIEGMVREIRLATVASLEIDS